MIYNSTHSDDYLWYLILRGKTRKRKTKIHPNRKFLIIFNGRSKKIDVKKRFRQKSVVRNAELKLFSTKFAFDGQFKGLISGKILFTGSNCQNQLSN